MDDFCFVALQYENLAVQIPLLDPLFSPEKPGFSLSHIKSDQARFVKSCDAIAT
jgi:hypothetical protein